MIPSLFDVPVMINMFPGGKTPYTKPADLEAFGYRYMIVPSDVQRACIQATESIIQAIVDEGGGTVELRRTFDNGWSVGLWSTLTDVPFDKFGEGSFDKGLFFKVPFNIFAGRNTRGVFESRLRPIQRDGGQRLEGFSGNIWYDLRGLRYDALTENKWRMKP